jgi:hypothetical protein
VTRRSRETKIYLCRSEVSLSPSVDRFMLIPGMSFRTSGRCPAGLRTANIQSDRRRQHDDIAVLHMAHRQQTVRHRTSAPRSSASPSGNLSTQTHVQPIARMPREATPLSMSISRHSLPGPGSIRSEIMKNAIRLAHGKRRERTTQVHFSGILILSFTAFLMPPSGLQRAEPANVPVKVPQLPSIGAPVSYN